MVTSNPEYRIDDSERGFRAPEGEKRDRKHVLKMDANYDPGYFFTNEMPGLDQRIKSVGSTIDYIRTEVITPGVSLEAHAARIEAKILVREEELRGLIARREMVQRFAVDASRGKTSKEAMDFLQNRIMQAQEKIQSANEAVETAPLDEIGEYKKWEDELGAMKGLISDAQRRDGESTPAQKKVISAIESGMVEN